MKINEKPVFHLNLKRQWFDMILSGEKTEEYREKKKHWNRIFTESGRIKIAGLQYHPSDVIICFSNGYSKNRDKIFIECKGLRIGYGKKEWGAEKGDNYFILSLGKILKKVTK